MKDRKIGFEFLALVVALIWGTTFVAQRSAMETIGPWAFTGVRFLLGVPLLLVFVLMFERRYFIHNWRRVLYYSLVPGTILAIGSVFQQVAIVTTYASKAGLITSLYICIVPFLAVFIGYRLKLNEITAAFVALTGIYFLSVTDTFSLAIGDLLLLFSAFVWAFHILSIDYYLRYIKPLSLAVTQIAYCGIFSFIGALFLEPINSEMMIQTLPELVYSGLVSAGLAFGLQIICQQYVSPNRLSLIISTEALFAVIGGWLFLTEILTARELFGALLLLFALILVRLNRLSTRLRKSKSE